VAFLALAAPGHKLKLSLLESLMLMQAVEHVGAADLVWRSPLVDVATGAGLELSLEMSLCSTVISLPDRFSG